MYTQHIHIPKQLLSVAAHLRRYIYDRGETTAFSALDFVEYLHDCEDVYVGSNRKDYPRNALVFIDKAEPNRHCVIRKRSACFLHGLWARGFLSPQAVYKPTQPLESKFYKCQPLSHACWRPVPILAKRNIRPQPDPIPKSEPILIEDDEEWAPAPPSWLPTLSSPPQRLIPRSKLYRVLEVINWCGPASFFSSGPVQAVVAGGRDIESCRAEAKLAKKKDMRAYHPDKWVQRGIRLDSPDIFTSLKGGHDTVAEILSEPDAFALEALKRHAYYYEIGQ